MNECVFPGKVHPEPTDSGWFKILDSVSPANVLDGDITCDWLVIGGGWMGLHAARRLAELDPEGDIALVDAGRIGNNAAGRCAGYAIDLAHNPRNRHFAEDVKDNSEENHINLEGIAYMQEAVEEHSVDCEWDPQGKYHAAASEKGIANLNIFARAMDNLNQPYRWVNADEIHQVTGSKYYLKALHAPGTVLFQPAMYMHNAMKCLPDNVGAYENTAVIQIQYDNERHICTTSTGEIRCKNLMLCNNAFLTQCGFYAGTAIPLYTYGSLTRILGESESRAIGDGPAFGVIPAHSFGTTVRRTPDNRLFLRNVYGYGKGFRSSQADVDKARTSHQGAFDRRYPEISSMGFEYSWGGMMTLSHNGGMVFGQLASRVFGTAFCNGTGVSRGTTFGKALAEHAMGKTSRSIEILLGRAKPVRKYNDFLTALGVRMTTAYQFFQAGKEV